MVWVQKWPFFQLFFLGNKGQNNVFYDILERKNVFKSMKTRSSQRRKNDIFPKGLTNGFGLNMAIFPTFFFQATQARKMSFIIFQNGKTFFQNIKTRSSRRRKYEIFFKGVNPWFWSKNGHFAAFFFQAINARKMSFMIFLNGKTFFQNTKTRSSKRRKIDIFPKGLAHGFGPKMAIFPPFFLGNMGQ